MVGQIRLERRHRRIALFDGEVITSTRCGWRRVSNLTSTYKVNYRIAKDSKLSDWKFNVTSCVPCGSE